MRYGKMKKRKWKMRIKCHSHLRRPQTMTMHCRHEGNFRDVYHTCARNQKSRVATGANHCSQHTHHERSLGSLSTLYAFCSSWNACVAASVLPFLSGWRCMASILYLFECQLCRHVKRCKWLATNCLFSVSASAFRGTSSTS